MNEQEIQRIAQLSRLQLNDEEISDFSNDLSKIIDFVQQHAETDLDAIEPLAHPLDIPQRLRSDTASEAADRDQLQSVSPQSQDGYYLVPKVID